MSILEKPKFQILQHGKCAGAPILKSIWDKFYLSYLLAQAGIHRNNGTPTWILCFLYIIGLVCGCSSVLKMYELVAKDAVLSIMFRGQKLAQYTLSRFLTHNYDWYKFGLKRVARLQEDADTMLKEGDCINLDDTSVDHPYGKDLPFLCWFFDHSKKVNIRAMSFVSIQAVLQNGLEYPLFYRVWLKPKNEDEKKTNPTKFDLAMKMLLDLRQSVRCRLWVAMDRWYLCKEFFTFLEDNYFDWVTKAKRNTALYRKEIENCTGRIRYVPISPITLIKEVFLQLKAMPVNGVAGISIANIYMKRPYKMIIHLNLKAIKSKRLLQHTVEPT